jgi:hypothetical protein
MGFLHTWALLPQSIYPTDLRSVNIAELGGSAYGGLPISRLGSLTYQVYGGARPGDWRSGEMYGYSDVNLPLTSLPAGAKIGEDIRWETPLKGLMVGMSHLDQNNHLVGMLMPYKIPGYADTRYDATWDGYGEYSWARLKVASEYRNESRASVLVIGGKQQPLRVAGLRSFFASVTWRFNPWFQLGTYNSRFYFVANSVPGLLAGADAHVFDQTVTARFDIRRYWTLKVEGHFMDGVGSPLSDHGFYLFDNPQGLKNHTNLLVLKLGFNM